jgi:hypothetical protein
MAKKKKTTKRRSSVRRRGRGRVSGIGMLPGVPLEAMAAIGAGAVASQALNGIAQNIDVLQRNPKILPIAKLMIGGFMVSKSKNPMVQNLGGGFIADGALQAARTFAPNVFKGLTGNVGSLIDLDNYVAGGRYMYGEDHSVGALQDEDYSLGSV